MMNVSDIRKLLVNKLENEDYVTDKTGVKTIELMGQSFIADEPAIVGSPNYDYINREIEWYNSESLYVNDIPGDVPAIWQSISSRHGRINSNYGWCILSHENGDQYHHCLNALKNDYDTRRAIMIYNRPSMQTDYNTYGMSDFMCTNSVQYLIRDNKLHAIVQMRSNDVVFGYKNDYAWQEHTLSILLSDLNEGILVKNRVHMGDIIWNSGSLHVYERHFDLLKDL